MNTRFCPVCLDQELVEEFSARYTGCGVTNYPFGLLHCKSCGLYAVNPMPSNVIYPQSRDASNNFIPHPIEATAEWFSPLIRNIKNYVVRGNLLDLGCNSGDFSYFAEQNGYSYTGVEIDEVASRAGIKLGRNVIQGDFTKFNFDKKFDVIVLNHVLEHIPDFSQTPKALANILSPNGVIIVNIPYFHSWLGQFLKQRWSQMAPFTHVWFFSKASIKKIFSPYFSSIEMFTDSSCEPHTIQTKDWKPLLKGLTIRFFRGIGHGDELRVILRLPQPQSVSKNQISSYM